MNNGQLLLSFHLKRGSNRGDPSSPITHLWLLPSNRIKIIIIRKEIKVLVNKEYQCFSLAEDLICFLRRKRSQFLTSHVPYDKCSGPKPINTKKTSIALKGVVLITIKKP